MDHGAAIDRAGDLEHRDFAGTAIDFDFGGLRREVVRARLVAVAAVIGKLGRIVEVAHADDRLAVRLIDCARTTARDRLEIGFAVRARGPISPLMTVSSSRRQVELLGGGVEQLLRARRPRRA